MCVNAFPKVYCGIEKIEVNNRKLMKECRKLLNSREKNGYHTESVIPEKRSYTTNNDDFGYV